MADQAKPSEPTFAVGQEHYKELAQSLLTMRSQARSIEAGCQAMQPLARQDIQGELSQCAQLTGILSQILGRIYAEIASHAFQ